MTSFAWADALLMSALEGEDLSQSAPTLPPAVTIARLVTALKTVHAVPLPGASLECDTGGKVLVHGDACLPNFLFRGDQLSGCVDLGAMNADDPEVDLAAAVWSLHRNLGPGHGLACLHEYGRDTATLEDVERLWLMYEGDKNA